MIAAIHQNNFLPWGNYFHKIKDSDIFVFLDSVEYSRGTKINRVKIRLNNYWLTVPVLNKAHQLIKDTLIDNSKKWKKKHLMTIEQAYKKTTYFNKYFPIIKEIYNKEWKKLSDFNIELIKEICKSLNIKTKFVKSSELNVTGFKNKLLISICKEVKADTYLSGIGAKAYNDEDLFKENGINIIHQGKFNNPFSIIDILFKEGDLNG